MTLKTVIAIAAFGWFTVSAQAGEMTQVALETFQIPKAVPNTTLDKTEGVSGTGGSLVRGNDLLSVDVSTKDLPEGAYTFWWHLTHPDKEVSILWAGSTVVASVNDNVALNSELRAGEANGWKELGRRTTLRSLDVTGGGSTFTDATLKNFAGTRALRTLKLRYCGGVTDAGIGSFRSPELELLRRALPV